MPSYWVKFQRCRLLQRKISEQRQSEKPKNLNRTVRPSSHVQNAIRAPCSVRSDDLTGVCRLSGALLSPCPRFQQEQFTQFPMCSLECVTYFPIFFCCCRRRHAILFFLLIINNMEQIASTNKNKEIYHWCVAGWAAAMEVTGVVGTDMCSTFWLPSGIAT